MNAFATSRPVNSSRLSWLARAVAALSCALGLGSQAQPFNPDTLAIPASHPRILFSSAADLARARAWYATHTYTPAARSAQDWAFVGLMTQNATACRKAIGLVMDSDRDPRYPDTPNEYQLSPDPPASPPVVYTDPARWIGEAAITTYDWCHDHFTVGERDTFRRRWNLWQTTLNGNAWGGQGMEENNYYWGYMRNSILLGIATWGENTVSGTDVARQLLMHGYATRFLDWLVNYYPRELAGGVTIEGSNYGATMFDYHVLPFITLRNLGEDPFARIRFWRESVYYLAYAMTPGRTAKPTGPEPCNQDPSNWSWQITPFADEERFSSCNNTNEIISEEVYGNGLLAYGNLFANRDSGQLARRIRQTVNQRSSPWLRAFFADDNPAPTVSFNQFPLEYFAPASRSVYTRSAWGAGASSLSLMFGRSPAGGHKHFDAGNVQWWRNGRWVSRESTGYVGSGESVAGLDGVGRVDVNHPVAHNVVLFEGRANIDGETGLAEGNAEMLRLFANADFSYGAADLTKSYRYRLGPNRCRYDWPYAQNAVREFVFLRAIETLVMIDRLTGSSDVLTYPPNGNAIQCYQPELTPPALTASQVRRHVIVHGMESFTQSGGWYLSNSGNERLAVNPLLPATRNVTVVNERNTPTGGGAQGNVRLDIRASGSPTIEFVTVLHAGPGSGTLPVVSSQSNGNERTVTIDKGGVQYAVTFQIGPLPQATRVSIGGNTVTPPASVLPLQPAEFNPTLFDIDGNGLVDAHTDGTLVMRYLLGLRGASLVAGVLGAGASRNTAASIEAHLATLTAELDADGDGQRRAHSDGMIIVRYMRGVRGTALIAGSVLAGTRPIADIEAALATATGF